ncbi:MAG TPA: bifunctional 2-C-methyl-D-erythritol 4-phosphate cytidylyltransferase/2-C-methyl-D-erythritol 2,4-cyclodiphosphate synthase [Devosiaceae bacterium]|nr:bifunctional 2-C-methyl-D-erythritol 4-phosphate cytidylyltransferase/2-C-methyl-D-erythritol 2,4-cyclodiphosphate synthase [Devosiaceae bacterium]
MSRRKTTAAIVVAAGRGERATTSASSLPKQYRLVHGVPVMVRAIQALLELETIDWVLPVIHAEHTAFFDALGLDDPRILSPVAGGAHRQESVRAGLESLSALQPDLVLVHDAARPFVEAAVTAGVITALEGADAALPAVAVTDTIKRSVDGRTVTATEDRHTLFAAQTPQGFRFPQILAAHLRAAPLPRQFTDDAAIAEWAGLSVVLTPGSGGNIKITHPEDFDRAGTGKGGGRMETRVGTGFDVHAFAEGNAVWLAGVEIAHTRRLSGHSDADVGLHALADAIYGALAEGDIGRHFPPSDPQWKGADSAQFLKHAAELVAKREARIVNLDLTLICEAPKIARHAAAMCEAIAGICGIAPGRVSVKATTSERLGFTGREEGIAAMATASIEMPRGD